MKLASIGVERLLKLSVSVHFLDEHGYWPSIDEMKHYGHDLGDLQVKALEIIDARGMRSEYVEDLVAFLTCSPTVTALLDALSHYGRGGRFYHLNVLGCGKRSEKFMSPSEHWELIELAAIAEIPENEAAIDADFYAGLAILSKRVAVLLDKWWFALHRIMLNGSFVPHGKQLGWLAWEIDRPDHFSTN